MCRGQEKERGGGLVSAIGSVAESIKDKLSLSKDEKEERREPVKKEDVTVVCPAVKERDDDVMVRVKEADQSTGQWFNDVGKLGEEGTGPPALHDARHGKK